jgi:hypothetical protein
VCTELPSNLIARALPDLSVVRLLAAKAKLRLTASKDTRHCPPAESDVRKRTGQQMWHESVVQSAQAIMRSTRPEVTQRVLQHREGAETSCAACQAGYSKRDRCAASGDQIHRHVSGSWFAGRGGYRSPLGANSAGSNRNRGTLQPRRIRRYQDRCRSPCSLFRQNRDAIILFYFQVLAGPVILEVITGVRG